MIIHRTGNRIRKLKFILICFGIIALLLSFFGLLRSEIIDSISQHTSLTGQDTFILYQLLIILTLYISFCCFVLRYYIHFFSFDPVFFFTFVAVLFGILFLFIITPLSVPDEKTHYAASYEISTHLFSKDGIAICNSYYFDFDGFERNKNVASGYLRILCDFAKPPQESELISVNALNSMSSLVYFLEYIPQAAGITLARLLNLNFIQTFLLGRLFNLSFYVLCLYYSLREAPEKAKSLFGIIGTLPITLQQAASYSYDSFIIGLSLIVLAITLSFIFGCPVSFNKYIVLATFLFFLAPAKGIYCIFAFLFLLIPSSAFFSRNQKKKYFIALFSLCIAAFLIFALPQVKKNNGLSNNTGNSFTLYHIISNPYGTLKMFINTMSNYVILWIGESIGYRLSGLTLITPAWIIVAYCIILFIVSQNSPIDIRRFRILRLSFLSCCFCIVVAFMLTMYFTWINTSYSLIEGVQGRYFTPVLPLLFLSFNIGLPRNEKMNPYISFLSVLLLARTSINIICSTI